MQHNCLVCSTVFENYHEYQEHMKIHKGPLKCPQCSKTFAYRATLKKHLIIHTNEKNFVCQICHKAMNRKENMKRHYEMVHKMDGSLVEIAREPHNPLIEFAEQFNQLFSSLAPTGGPVESNQSKFDFRRLGETHDLPSASSSLLPTGVIQSILNNFQRGINA